MMDALPKNDFRIQKGNAVTKDHMLGNLRALRKFRVIVKSYISVSNTQSNQNLLG
jgi:hypothetical protein